MRHAPHAAPPWRRIVSAALAWLAGVLVLVAGRDAAAITITGYTAAANNRFTGVFPTSMSPNTSPSFVGLAYDWSGVGWSTSSTIKGFGFISPRHYLVATHYGGGATIAVRAADGTILTGTQASVTNTGYGAPVSGTTDLSLGRLTASLPDFGKVARYAVLDLHASSATDSLANYGGRPVLNYGRWPSGSAGPRIAAGTLASAVSTLYGTNNGYSLTGTSAYYYVAGDSGSPMFMPWKNADGGDELTIIGNNAAVDLPNGNNIQNFIGRTAVLGKLNAMMTPDGYVLRVTGSVAAAWQGGSGGNATEWSQLGRAGNWTSGSIPSDLYVRFAGDETTFRTITVNAATDLRGLYFNSTGSGTLGFSFGGTQTLTIGRGGVTNYDVSRQEFTAPVALGDHQYWDVGAGGVTAGGITTNGRLLEIAGSGTARITGSVTGTGGLALSGHRLELTGSSSYTGGTWVHAGTLVVNGGIAASSGVSVAAAAALAGSGTVAAISGAGAVGPGNSPGILTALSVDPLAGLDFDFEFTKTGSPIWSSGTASGNDVLRLTSGTSPFGGRSLTAANVVNVYLDAGPLAAGSTFRGGFFTDRDADFLASIEGATFAYYLAALSGTRQYGGVSYAAYGGPLTFTLSTVAQTATFAGGTESGFVMQFVAVPEPAGWVILAGTAACAATRRRRRCRAGHSPRGTAALAGDRGGL